jgi:hypothetical protein
MSMRTEGEGTLAADLIPTINGSIDFTGSGDLSAEAALVISMFCDMTGSGTLSASIVGLLNMSIDLEGSGDLSANLSGIANMLIDLEGSGDLEATIAAYGNMEIDIVVTGTGLTTSNVGQAVWSALALVNNEAGTMGEKLNDAGSAANPWTEVIEGSYTAAEVLRLLASVAGGKSTVTGNQVIFRDLNDTVDRVDATVVSGERTDVNLDL